jgi:hypothetical protein
VSDEQPMTEGQAEWALELVREEFIKGGGAAALAAKQNEGIFELSGLDARTFWLVRIAALAASSGGQTGWDVTLDLAEGLELNEEEILGTLVAITPIVGTARMLKAAEHILNTPDDA